MTTKKPSKSKSKKPSTTAAATSKKVKRTVSAKQVVEPVALAPAALAPVVEVAPVIEVAPAPVEQAPVRTMSRAEFMVLVRREAYNRAARRNFKNGSPFQDWVNAEAAVSGKLAAEGVRPELS